MKQTEFSPGINADINNTVRACEFCQILQPNHQREPLLNDNTPTSSFESVSADFFSVAGKFFIIITDCLSGWPVIIFCGCDITAAVTIHQFCHYFHDVGGPVQLMTDGRHQLMNQEFATFLKHWGVWHDIFTTLIPVEWPPRGSCEENQTPGPVHTKIPSSPKCT